MLLTSPEPACLCFDESAWQEPEPVIEPTILPVEDWWDAVLISNLLDQQDYA